MYLLSTLFPKLQFRHSELGVGRAREEQQTLEGGQNGTSASVRREKGNIHERKAQTMSILTMGLWNRGNNPISIWKAFRMMSLLTTCPEQLNYGILGPEMNAQARARTREHNLNVIIMQDSDMRQRAAGELNKGINGAGLDVAVLGEPVGDEKARFAAGGGAGGEGEEGEGTGGDDADEEELEGARAAPKPAPALVQAGL
ncbi:hypothetical protein C8R44DRAFT_751936 [Mycena epipterygia]|nr:hypothetical protein C8R44DRAFT_751936 [Mycena epipterygia]